MVRLYYPRSSGHAFSLVELSIVLVILGLLVGGVLAGQSLIRAAEVRKIITTTDKYRGAVLQFRDKYFALPSDLNNAINLWGDENVCDAPGIPLGTIGTCNGNGDGTVLWDTSSNTEHYRVWEHLGLAGLIEGSYNMSSAFDEGPDIGRAYPGPFIGQAGVYFGMGGVHGVTAHVFKWGAVNNGSTQLSKGFIPAAEAYSLDLKLDDGLPGKGKVLGSREWTGTPGTVQCVSHFSNPDAVYTNLETAISAATCISCFSPA